MKYRLGDITVKHWNDWDRVPRDPFTIFAYATGALGLQVGAALVFTAVSYIAITAVTSWAIRALSPKPDFGSAFERGLLVNTREATAPQQIVYGEVRKGGTITYVETTGGGNAYLHQIICLAGHEVHEIGDIYINDEVAALDDYGRVTTAKWTDVNDGGAKKILIKKFTGADDQDIYSTLSTDLVGLGYPPPKWQVDGADPTDNEDVNFKGEGIACLYVRFTYHAGVFADGIPLITAKIKGKKVYDPRTSTTGYSANAALCIRDYLVSTYGLDNDGDTNDTSFSAAANTCDESVDLVLADESRYEINGVISLDQSPSDVLGDMMTACSGTLFWGQGEWHLKVGEYTTPTKTFTLDDLRGQINLDTKHSRRDNFNIVRGTFNDANQNYIRADYPEIRSSSFIADDNGIESALDLALPFTTSPSMAQRLAKMTLFRAREQMTFTADFGLEAFEVECGDIIALTIDRYGWSAKEFEVVGWKFKNDGDAGDLRVALTLRETSSAAFSWNAEEAEITSNDSTLPDPRAGLDINNLAITQVTEITTDGTHTVFARISWDEVDSAYVDHYEVQWRKTADTDYQSTTTSEQSLETGLLIDNTPYTVRVRAVTGTGYRGAFSTASFTSNADVTAPAAPTGLSVDPAYRSNVLSWTNPTDDDFREVDVYVNTSNNSGTATLLGSVGGTNFTHGGLGQNVTRYYWLKAKDFTGNISAFSTGASGTTLIDPVDGADGANGDTVVTGKVYYQTLQASSPSTPSASSYNVSTASFTGLTSGWSLEQPSVDITDTSLKEWSSNFTVTIDGVTSAQTIAFTSPTGAIQVTTDIESDNYVAGVSGWSIQRDTGSAEFGAASIRGTLAASQIQIDNVTLDTNASNQLIIKSGGVNTPQITTDALSDAVTVSTGSASVSTGFPGTIVLTTNVSGSYGDKFLIAATVDDVTHTSSTAYLNALVFLNGASTVYMGDIGRGISSTSKGGFSLVGVNTLNTTGTVPVNFNVYSTSSSTLGACFLQVIRLKR